MRPGWKRVAKCGDNIAFAPGAIKSASQLCRLLMRAAPVIFPTSVGS
jgi:hypothetical protein